MQCGRCSVHGGTHETTSRFAGQYWSWNVKVECRMQGAFPDAGIHYASRDPWSTETFCLTREIDGANQHAILVCFA